MFCLACLFGHSQLLRVQFSYFPYLPPNLFFSAPISYFVPAHFLFFYLGCLFLNDPFLEREFFLLDPAHRLDLSYALIQVLLLLPDSIESLLLFLETLCLVSCVLGILCLLEEEQFQPVSDLTGYVEETLQLLDEGKGVTYLGVSQRKRVDPLSHGLSHLLQGLQGLFLFFPRLGQGPPPLPSLFPHRLHHLALLLQLACQHLLVLALLAGFVVEEGVDLLLLLDYLHVLGLFLKDVPLELLVVPFIEEELVLLGEHVLPLGVQLVLERDDLLSLVGHEPVHFGVLQGHSGVQGLFRVFLLLQLVLEFPIEQVLVLELLVQVLVLSLDRDVRPIVLYFLLQTTHFVGPVETHSLQEVLLNVLQTLLFLSETLHQGLSLHRLSLGHGLEALQKTVFAETHLVVIILYIGGTLLFLLFGDGTLPFLSPFSLTILLLFPFSMTILFVFTPFPFLLLRQMHTLSMWFVLGRFHLLNVLTVGLSELSEQLADLLFAHQPHGYIFKYL